MEYTIEQLEHMFKLGYPIQYRQLYTDKWSDNNNPAWSPNFEYRVKPGIHKISLKNNEMKQLKIQIPEGHEVDTEKSDLSKGLIFFKLIKYKYPMSRKEMDDNLTPYFIDSQGQIHSTYANDINNLSTESRAEAFLALMQLVELRDAWNKIDGFIDVEWEVFSKVKYVILISNGLITGNIQRNLSRVLYFGSEETRDLFLKTFKHLLEQAKELL